MKMSLDELTVVHATGMIPEFEISGEDISPVVHDYGQGFIVDYRKHHERIATGDRTCRASSCLPASWRCRSD